MRVLYLSDTLPRDPARDVHGVFKRQDLFVEALKRRGDLHVLFFVEPDIGTDPASVGARRRSLGRRWDAELELALCPRRRSAEPPTRWGYYGRPILDRMRGRGDRRTSGPRQVEAVEAALDREPDLVFVHRLSAMAPLLLAERPLPPVALDLDDIEHRRFLRNLEGPPFWSAKRLRYLQLPFRWWHERRAISRADRTFVCSGADRRYLERTMRVEGVRVVRNAVEIPEPRPLAASPTALFLGTLRYPPNRNAAVELMSEIWPRVRSRVPDARLRIAGRGPDGVPGSDAPPPGVEFLGFVDELEELYRDTRLVCTPVRSGGGTRFKILEAAAHGKPIVSTTLGAEGLLFEDGDAIVIRDDPMAFAEATSRLLVDDAAAERLGRSAAALAARAYGREASLERIHAHLDGLVPRG